MTTPRSVFPFLLTLVLALAQAAYAQDVTVRSADPSSAVQGTTELDVVINGAGFDNSAAVRFLVTGTESQGGIRVNAVRVRGSKKIIANITVAADAEVADFDIEVTLSRSRGGKGTTLFRVEEKTTGSGHSELSANFCLALVGADPGLAPDTEPDPKDGTWIGVYCDDKRQKVKVGTGSGPGFRFDTNTSKNAPRRTVRINVSGSGVPIKNDSGTEVGRLVGGLYEIDLRFNKTDADGGLDLGAMYPGDPVNNIPGEVDHVPIDMSFKDPVSGASYGAAWGNEAATPFSHGHLTDSTCYTLDARVERISPSAWTIESNRAGADACLWTMDSPLTEQQTGTKVSLPFRFTIEIK